MTEVVRLMGDLERQAEVSDPDSVTNKRRKRAKEQGKRAASALVGGKGRRRKS